MKTEHSLAQLCAAFEVRRSGYQAWMKAEPSERERTDAALLTKIRTVHTQHKGRYGAPRIQEELATQGDRHGCKRIARLMKAAGIRGRCARRFVPCTTQSDHDQPIAPNLLAEVLLDGVLATTLYRRLRAVDSRHWLETAVARTWVPVVVVAAFFVIAGAVCHWYAPEASTLSGVWRHYCAKP